MDSFNQHYTLINDHNILICKISDHWTYDWAEKYVREIKRLVSNFSGQSWCRIVNMQQFRLGTPRAVARMSEFGHWSMANGCVEHVFLFANEAQESLVRSAYAGLFDLHCFDYEHEAIAYCQKKLRRQFLLDRNQDVEIREARIG